MKLYTLLLLFCAGNAFSQIKNANFETGRDSFPEIPNIWNYKAATGYTVLIDNKVHFDGSKSLCVSTTGDSKERSFQPFSQVCDIDIKQVQVLKITAYIKTEKVKGNAGLWCQLWDKDEKTIGFGNLDMQDIIIKDDNEWKKYSLNLVVRPHVKKLLLGGFLAGEGKAWFDHFEIEQSVNTDSAVSKPVAKYIADFLKIIKNNSLFTDSLIWNDMYAETDNLLKGLKTISESRFVTGYILSKLRAAGDNHSFFMPPQNAKSYGSENTDGRQPEGRYLGENIGYVNVPGYGSIDPQAGVKFAEKIQDIIKSIDNTDNIRGWIVDLRENTGGNMYPMIAGLGPLIGDGIAGYFISLKSETTWQYDHIIKTSVKIKTPYRLKNEPVKIAVLTGSHTGSSGEMTTMSFIGKSNTKLFGQPTAGLTTGNRGFALSDGAYLYLATSFTADRNKKRYLHKIEPDFTIADVPGNDDTIAAAKNWLLAY